MTHTKKVAALITALVMTTSMLYGCSSDNNGGSNTPAGSAQTDNKETEGNINETGMPIVNEPLTLKMTFLSSHTLTKNLQDLPMFQELEKRTNVKIQWDQVRSGAAEKKSLLLAGGDLPDAFFGGGLSPEDFSNNEGMFLPLEDLIDKYAPNIKKMFEEYPDTKKLATNADGHIYSLTSVRPFMPKSLTVGMINQEWLDKLGLQMPTTIDEFEKVLIAFRDQDPNGNGKKDEIPLDWNNSRGLFSITSLLGAFGQVSDQTDSLFGVKDGTVDLIPATDQWKQFANWIHKLYSEGLINKEVFTQNYDQMQAKAQATDAAKVGATFGWSIDNRVSPKWAPQYSVLLPLKGTNQDPKWPTNYARLAYGLNMFSMTKNNPNPEATIRWIDELYSPEMSIQMFYGSIGTAIQKNDTGDVKYEILPPQDGMDADAWKWTNAPADNGPMYVSEQLQKETKASEDTAKRIEQDAAYDNFRPDEKDVYPIVFFDKDTQSKVTVYANDIYKYIDQMWAKWVTKGGVDKDWDGYLKELKKMGLDDYLAIHQQAYDNYFKQ